MDAKFMELLGNILLGSARNKQQTDQFFEWLQTGFSDPKARSQPWAETGVNELFDMFRSWYGLNEVSRQSAQYQQLSEEALKQFHASMKDTFFTMGFVDRAEHLALVEKYEQLKAQCQEQEETINHLKMLLQGQADMTDQFQDMVSKQGQVYQEMIEQFGTLFSPQKNQEKTDPKKTR